MMSSSSMSIDNDWVTVDTSINNEDAQNPIVTFIGRVITHLKIKAANISVTVKVLIDKEVDKDLNSIAKIADDSVKVIGLIPKKPSVSSASSSAPPAFIIKLVNDSPLFIKNSVKKIKGYLSSDQFKEHIKNLSFAATAVVIPISVYNIIDNGLTINASKNENDKESIADSSFDMIENVGILGSAISGTLEFLIQAEVIAEWAGNYIPFISAISAVFRGAKIVKASTTSFQSNELHNEFKSHLLGISTEKDFIAVKKFLSNNLNTTLAKKYFGRDQSWILEKLENIHTTKEKELAISIINRRLRSTTITNIASPISTGLWLLANGALFIPTVGFIAPGLFFTAAIVTVSRDGFSLYERHAFRKSLSVLEKDPFDIKPANYKVSVIRK